MFKRIEKWLEAKADAAMREQYDNGFGYAAIQLLKYGTIPLAVPFDNTDFDTGLREADQIISELQHQAKKLDRAESENKDLREIVRGMQKELGRLLAQLEDVSKPQALSNPPERKPVPELPFGLSDLPEWANWVAQDENGSWYSFEKRPYIFAADSQWSEESKNGRVYRVCRSEVAGDWKDTLYEIPKR